MMSDPGSDFRLYHSNSLDVLAALLARARRGVAGAHAGLARASGAAVQVAVCFGGGAA